MPECESARKVENISNDDSDEVKPDEDLTPCNNKDERVQNMLQRKLNL